jgi:hypothetical protein
MLPWYPVPVTEAFRECYTILTVLTDGNETDADEQSEEIAAKRGLNRIWSAGSI